MNNYLLSVDPSIKNTGFTLWENKKPIWISSFNFKKDYENNDCLFENNIKSQIGIILWEKACELANKELNYVWYEYCLQTYLIVERGIFNPKFGRGKETLDHLRGFIAGQFNKLLNKDMLVSPSEWKKWYVKNDKYCSAMTFVNGINYKWDKNVSLFMCENLIKENYWNITISNHDQAESLLIGWYYLNKEKKNE